MRSDDHDRVDGLLPWFVNNTLEPEEHDRVRSHLGSCDTCRSNLSLLTVVQSTVRHASTTPIVPPPHTDRLFEALDRCESGNEQRRPLRTTVRAAALAGALLLTALPVREDSVDPVRYQTATSTSRQESMDYVFRIQFEQATPPASRERVLRELGVRDISRTETGSTYRVTVNLPAASLEELEQYTTELESLPQIESVSVIALQLPMQRRQ